MSGNGAPGPAWQASEDETLRRLYPTHGWTRLVGLLPGRTTDAIRMRAQRLGVAKSRVWSPAECEHLKTFFGVRSNADIAKALGRTVEAVANKCCKLGLYQRQAKQGHETIHHAAQRFGISHGEMRRVIAWSGLQAVRILGRESRAKTKQVIRHYITDSLDTAFDAWSKTETPRGASKRIGIAPNTLVQWLLDAGIDGNATMALRRINKHRPERANIRSSKHWHVSSEVIDRVVAERLRMETVEEAARRVGVHRETMAKILRLAGLGSDRRLGKFSPESVDAAVSAYRGLNNEDVRSEAAE